MNEDKLKTRIRQAYRDIRKMRKSEEPWVFKKWDYCPGPSLEDFAIRYHSRRDYLRAVLRYYFGSPRTIDGWIIPLHKHPELTLPGVKHAIADAVNVSVEAFEGIAEQRYRRTDRISRRLGNPWLILLASGDMEWACRWQFLQCPHKTDDTIFLALRRDMQETYIVHGSKDQLKMD